MLHSTIFTAEMLNHFYQSINTNVVSICHFGLFLLILFLSEVTINVILKLSISFFEIAIWSLYFSAYPPAMLQIPKSAINC